MLPPAKESDGTYRYRFLRWDKSYKNVTKNLEIRPVYEKSLIPVTNPNVEDTPVVTPEPTTAKPTTAPVTQTPTQAPTQKPTQAPATTQTSATQAPATEPEQATVQTETPAE